MNTFIKLILIMQCPIIAFAADRRTEFDFAKLRFPVKREALPNGLTILLHEDHSLPLVSYHTWFRVGSKNEEVGFTGIAHLFEHLMFKGAKRYDNKEFDRVLHANGATNNAFTSTDYTGYYEDLPSSSLELVVDIESDRLENLKLNADSLKSEREVVKEERRMRTDNSISGALREALYAQAYEVHPYKWPVVGWMKDLDQITLDKCKAFFKNFYSVSNAVVVVAGDFDSEKALSLIKKYYGGLKKVEVLRPFVPAEPPQRSERKGTIEKPAKSEHVMVAYHIGKQGDEDSYAMDLIANILTEGDSSRLYRRLVYADQTALSVGGYSSTPQDPGLMNFIIEMKPGVSSEKAMKGFFDELEKIKKRAVKPNELEKAKNQVMKQWVDSVKTIHGKANLLALNEIVTGNYENLFDDLKKYREVSLEDVQEAAKKYFIESNRTTVKLIPKAESPNGKQ